MTRHVGVIGHPIGHSKSPALHLAAYGVLGLPWTYDAIDVEPGGLTSFVGALDHSWVGLSITMPHKVEALTIANSVDLIARATGSVNTLVFGLDPVGKRVISGYNTDVAGMVMSLGDAGVTSARSVAIVGGGATAASAIVVAAQLGAERVSVLVRNVEAAEYLLDVGNQVGIVVVIHDINDMAAIPSVDVAISTVPGTAQTSLAPLARVPGATLLDVAYSPWPSVRGSAWACQTNGEGIVVSGLAMLAHQALMQVRLFHSGDMSIALPNEPAVRLAMFAAVGLP